MKEITWDLTPSWWPQSWWKRWRKSKTNAFDHRDPVAAIAYAISADLMRSRISWAVMADALTI